jgi:hypothetical protein
LFAVRFVIVGGMGAGALAQHFLQGHRTAVLLKQVAERFFGEVLDREHVVLGQAIKGVPGLKIKGYAFANSSGSRGIRRLFYSCVFGRRPYATT